MSDVREHTRESQVCIDIYQEFCRRYPELGGELSHFPAGEHRVKPVASKLKAMGVPRGRADYDLLVRRGPYAGLFLEVKPLRKGAPDEAQIAFLARKRAEGYYCAVGYGCNESLMILGAYVDGDFDSINWMQSCDTRSERRKARKERQNDT